MRREAVSGWQVLPDPSGPEVHIVPEAETDVVAHALSQECICGPTVEPIELDDGGINWLYSHHSLDGREASE